MMLVKLASELEQQVYELKRRLDQVQRRVDADAELRAQLAERRQQRDAWQGIADQEPQRPDTATAAMHRAEVGVSIDAVFITLVWLICLVHVLSTAAGHRLL
jgi:hypothetical protein